MTSAAGVADAAAVAIRRHLKSLALSTAAVRCKCTADGMRMLRRRRRSVTDRQRRACAEITDELLAVSIAAAAAAAAAAPGNRVGRSRISEIVPTPLYLCTSHS